MDNNTQQVSQPVAQSVQPDPAVVKQEADNKGTQAASSVSPQQKANVAGQVARPVEPPGKNIGQQQISVSGHPEQGSFAAFESDEDDGDNDDDEEKLVAKQEAKDRPVVQSSHPEIIIQKELGQAGVKPGNDADTKQLPEEPEQLGDVQAQNQQQITATQLGDATLTMSYEEAQLAVKKERSIRKGISWIVREIKRQWDKLNMKSKS